MEKNVIKLNETQLRQIVTESVKKVLKEVATDEPKQIYHSLLHISDKMRDYAWVAIDDVNITTAIIHLGKAVDAWKQVMSDNGIK